MKKTWQIKISILDKNNNELSVHWLDGFKTRKAAVTRLTDDGFKKSKGCWEKTVRQTIRPKNGKAYERRTYYRARIWPTLPMPEPVRPHYFTF